MELNQLLPLVSDHNASDLHIIAGLVPTIRVNGIIVPLPNAATVTVNDCLGLCNELLDAEDRYFSRLRFEKDKDIDIAYAFEDNNKQQRRCRINIYQEMNGPAFAMRLIPAKIPTITGLQMPRIFETLTQKKHGLIIVAGPTGNGKTTTLAAMVNAVNESRSAHIVTLEDPIEYVHVPKRSIISQREVGQTVVSFVSGLRSALRSDPDVILVGEMRDQETVATALAAAETGHLVLSTLHTANVIEAVDLILHYFPAEQQQQIQSQLANCFEGIIAQRLLPNRNQKGRVAAMEILTKTDATTNIIRSGRVHQIRDYMHLDAGMQTMDEAIKDLKNRNLID